MPKHILAIQIPVQHHATTQGGSTLTTGTVSYCHERASVQLRVRCALVGSCRAPFPRHTVPVDNILEILVPSELQVNSASRDFCAAD